MQNLEKAKSLARRAHAGQKDKAGQPYFDHLEFIACRLDSEYEKTVAYLHDVVEDTDTKLDELAVDFPPFIVKAVDAITKRDGESYEEYLLRVKANGLARAVKLVDLTHNRMIERISSPTEKDYQRLKKYDWAYQFLLQG